MKRFICLMLVLLSFMTLCCCAAEPAEEPAAETIKYGSFQKTKMYYKGSGDVITDQYTQKEYVFFDESNLYWYVQSGEMWICRNFDLKIENDVFYCTPKYENGLVDITFSYDKATHVMSTETGGIVIEFTYESDKNPVDKVDTEV